MTNENDAYRPPAEPPRPEGNPPHDAPETGTPQAGAPANPQSPAAPSGPAGESAPGTSGPAAEPPRFGQRSESWGSAPEAEPERPWPVYQQGPGGTQPPSGAPTYAPSYGAGPAYGAPGTVPPGPAQGGPYPPGSGQVGGGPAGCRGPVTDLPSRAGAIWTLVLGLLFMFVVAPVVTIGTILTQMDFASIAEGTVSNGSEIVVDDSGTLGVAGLSGTLTECTLAGPETVTLYPDSSNLVTGSGLTPGTYTIDCGAPGEMGLMVLNGNDLSSMIQGGVWGVVIGSIIGIAGLGMTIGGIIWLVSRNRARREYMRNYWR